MSLPDDRASHLEFLVSLRAQIDDQIDRLLETSCTAPDAYSYAETAQLLGLTKDAVRQRVRRGKLPRATGSVRAAVDGPAARALRAAAMNIPE